MSTLKTLTALIALATASTAVLAQTTDGAQECTDKRVATEILETQIREWKNSSFGQALETRNANGDLILLVGTPQSISASTTSPQFGKSREMAFAKSFLQTQTEFIQLTSQRIQADMASEYLDAQPSQAELSQDEAQDQGKLLRLGEKVFALTEAKLDNALREAGVADEDIAKSDTSKKIQTFKDSLARSAAIKAFGRVAGVLPVQNFEATDCSNRAAVTTISVFSDNNLDFVKDVLNKRPMSAQPDKAAELSLEKSVDKEITDQEILDIYGLRKTYDQNGYSSLVSYGQWSYNIGGATPKQRETKRKSALIQAEANAKAHIATFLNGTAQSVVDAMTQEVSEEYINVSKEGNDTTTTDELIERQFKSMSSKASVELTGLRTIATWTMQYPGLPDITMAGAVVAWSPQYADAVNKATGSNKRQAVSQSATSTEASTTPTGQVQIRSSKVKNNAADF